MSRTFLRSGVIKENDPGKIRLNYLQQKYSKNRMSIFTDIKDEKFYPMETEKQNILTWSLNFVILRDYF